MAIKLFPKNNYELSTTHLMLLIKMILISSMISDLVIALSPTVIKRASLIEECAFKKGAKISNTTKNIFFILITDLNGMRLL